MQQDDHHSVLVVGVGAAQGLGAAIARRFAEGGFSVVIAGRSEAKLVSTVAALKTLSPNVSYVLGDASVAADAKRFVQAAQAIAPLALAVHNAGPNNPAPFLETTAASFEEHWQAHTLAAFHLAQAALPAMLERKRGSLFFTGASASLRGKARFSPFAAAKAGTRMLAQSLAREFGPQGIHVANVILDGVIDGDRALSLYPQLAEKRAAAGLLTIDAIADAYWFLHHQQRTAWTLELDLRPWSEEF
ncbi:SDR family NAD(P)-dependent oxidoreductase [Paracoccus aminophilus]|uniref:Short-chain dehydrogenase/reductase SDR n=1 Tax=Paracoccus aminophilus JCM 7686 TaxID=1367847 RepID=S5XUA2_PARAH|nr:SDR family NAD(P)-dependent oxidoreductase [Paracoccus aminophilus]AGT08782.1 short-chain dehydrogenase/reductase SDR [Paracoccus aminophilus JCM 7686]